MHHLVTAYGENNAELAAINPDLSGDTRLDHVITLYREMNVPFGIIMYAHNRGTEAGRDVMWGRKWNSREYVEAEVLPKLMDFEYLKSLAPNTVGAHYYNLVKKWGIEDLYNQRFKPEEKRDDSTWSGQIYNAVSDDIRENFSRHALISHDIWHVLFRYDTSPLGEAMIQEVTAYLAGFKPAHIIGWGGAYKMAKATGSNLPWKVYKECRQNLKKVNKELMLYSPLHFLEKDIKEVRDHFGIVAPKYYKQYVEEFGDFVKNDTFHPNYRDEDFINVSVEI